MRPQSPLFSLGEALRPLALVSMLLFVSACSENPPETGTAITDVTVIDAASGVRTHQTVVFDGDEITAVLPADGDVPPVAETIDGAGKYLLPGLWDMHVHLTYDEAFTGVMPALFLSYGVTSVRDTGGLIEKLAPVVESMRAPDAVAPRVFFSGPLLDGRFVIYDGDGRPEIGIENQSVAAAEQHVDHLVTAGVSFVKIYELVSPDVFEALVRAARAHGLPIAAHVPLSMRASTAGPQVDSMEHLRNVELDCSGDSDELLAERQRILSQHEEGSGAELRARLHALQRGPAIASFDEARCAEVITTLATTIQVPTLRLNTLGLHPPFARDDWESALEQTPEQRRSDWQAQAEQWRAGSTMRDPTFGELSLSLVGRLHAAGVPIGAGTDTPIGVALPGYSLHTELERLVEAGLSPLEAIEAATVRPAEFFSLEDEMGSIAIGQRADLVLLDADPLEDIANTRSIVFVVSRGRVLRPEELR